MKFEKALDGNRIRLFESCTVMNIDDLVFYPVSLNNNSSNSKEQKRRRPLIKSDRGHYQLPEYLGIVTMQHTEYYYPLPYSFPGRQGTLLTHEPFASLFLLSSASQRPVHSTDANGHASGFCYFQLARCLRFHLIHDHSTPLRKCATLHPTLHVV